MRGRFVAAVGNHTPVQRSVHSDVVDVSVLAGVSWGFEAWKFDDAKAHLLEAHPHVHIIHEEEGNMSGYGEHLLEDGHCPDIGEPVTVLRVKLVGVIRFGNIPGKKLLINK